MAVRRLVKYIQKNNPDSGYSYPDAPKKSNKIISERAVAAEGNSDKFLTRDHWRSGCRQTMKSTGNRKEAGFFIAWTYYTFMYICDILNAW